MIVEHYKKFVKENPDHMFKNQWTLEVQVIIDMCRKLNIQIESVSNGEERVNFPKPDTGFEIMVPLLTATDTGWIETEFGTVGIILGNEPGIAIYDYTTHYKHDDLSRYVELEMLKYDTEKDLKEQYEIRNPSK